MISTRKIYKPLKDLVQSVKSNPALKPSSAMDEYTYLGAAYDTLIEHNRASQVARLIHGHYDDTSTEVLGLDGEGMTVVAFIIENASPEQLSELSDLIRTTLYWPAAVTSSEAISTILSDTLTGGDAIGDILTGIANLQKQAANVLSLTLAVGIGTRVQTLDQVRVSHRQAMMAAQYALTLGPSQVVPFQEIDDRKAVASQNRDTVASKICDYIDENFTRPELTADEIAEHVGLSVGYMRQIFRQERDTPLNDYLITIRLEHAKQLLISTEATAREISESVGFNDSRYFYTLFKKRVGMTADEYRKSAEGSEQNHEL
jgi:AraC-like DNA-binding protein